jgi:outer membrane protein TolC
LIAAIGCHHANRHVSDSSDSRVGVSAPWLHESCATSASLDHIAVSADELTPPRTTENPEAAEIWEITLEEAIAVALENSEVVRTLVGGGVSADLGTLTGATAIGGGAVGTGGTTVYDPAIAEQRVTEALAAFDTTLATSIFWARTDQPPGIFFGGGIPVPNQRDQASFRSSLTKPLTTGGTASIAFDSDYLFRPPFGGMRSPAQYTPRLEFGLRQPLLRGAGNDVNRAPIVIARLQSDASLWDFKAAMLSLVRGVEQAYWDLQSAHVALRTVEEVIPYTREAVRLTEERVKVNLVIRADLAQAQAEYLQFRQQRVQALATVLERETTLRNLLGLPPADKRRLVPIDDPMRAPIAVDWATTIRTALDYRPDIVRNRLGVRVRELQLLIAKNSVQPQLDLEGLWRVNGLDNELDEAIGLLTDNQFTDWQLGVTFSVPIGLRAAAANMQAAELRLDKERALLRQTVHSTSHRLNAIVRNLDSLYNQYQVARERLEASRIWLEGRRTQFEEPPPAREGQDSLLLALTNYLQALRSWSSAATATADLVAQYNTALAELEEAKGTLLSARNIQLQEDPCARIRFSQPRLPHVHTLDSGNAPQTPPREELPPTNRAETRMETEPAGLILEPVEDKRRRTRLKSSTVAPRVRRA